MDLIKAIIVATAFIIGLWFLVLLPVHLSAKLFRAKRPGYWYCILAVFVAYAITLLLYVLQIPFHALGLMQVELVAGAFALAGILATAFIFAQILRTGYWRGLGITILSLLLSSLLAYLMTLMLSFFGLHAPTPKLKPESQVLKFYETKVLSQQS